MTSKLSNPAGAAGEWTQEIVQSFGTCRKIADAINAAISAERKKHNPLLLRRLTEFHAEVESLGSLPDIKLRLAETQQLRTELAAAQEAALREGIRAGEFERQLAALAKVGKL